MSAPSWSAALAMSMNMRMAYNKELTAYSSAKGRRQAGSATKSPTRTSNIESYL